MELQGVTITQEQLVLDNTVKELKRKGWGRGGAARPQTKATPEAVGVNKI